MAKAMTQIELVQAFIDGAVSGDAANLHVDGNRLVHYSTTIAERHDGKLILNYTRYSLATGRVQKLVTDAVDADGIVKVLGVPEGERSLAKYLESDGMIVPDEYLMKVRHADFGVGYVLSFEDDVARIAFERGEKTLLWSLAEGGSKLEVIDSDVDERGK